MKFLCASLFQVLLATSVFAQVEGLAIKNSHSVDPKGYLYRGSQPGNKIAELKKLKISNVLIIKQQTRGEVDDEVALLNQAGIRAQVIPMKWQKTELEPLCMQVVEAVQTLQEFKRRGKKAYFHCTAGEDRTGLVAGLFRMVDQGWSASRAFKQEMCGNGYSDGDAGKPTEVIRDIEKTLTPVFMALTQNFSTASGLNPSVCHRITMPTRVPTCKKASSI